MLDTIILHLVDLGGEVAEVFSGAWGLGYQAVPGAGTTGGTTASIRCGPGSA
jgi:hypothetical protein